MFGNARYSKIIIFKKEKIVILLRAKKKWQYDKEKSVFVFELVHPEEEE